MCVSSQDAQALSASLRLRTSSAATQHLPCSSLTASIPVKSPISSVGRRGRDFGVVAYDTRSTPHVSLQMRNKLRSGSTLRRTENVLKRGVVASRSLGGMGHKRAGIVRERRRRGLRKDGTSGREGEGRHRLRPHGVDASVAVDRRDCSDARPQRGWSVVAVEGRAGRLCPAKSVAVRAADPACTIPAYRLADTVVCGQDVQSVTRTLLSPKALKEQDEHAHEGGQTLLGVPQLAGSSPTAKQA